MVLSLSHSVFAGQSVSLAPINFKVSAAHALSKFEQVVLRPENLLRRYRPVGVKISNKQVAGNEVSFTATKTVLFVSKSIYVHGIFESNEVARGCARGEVGYSLMMHFESSHHLVTDNVDRLQALICLREETDSKISGQIRSQINLGSRYSRTLGPIAVNLIKDQVQPLLSALTEEIRSMR